MNRKTRLLTAAFAISLGAMCASAQADTVYVDLSGAISGSLITGTGASFAQGFTTGPLALAPSGQIDVVEWDPVVSAESNSLLSQPDNQGNLAMLLGGGVLADSLTFTAGGWDGGSVQVTAFDLAGNTTGTSSFAGQGGDYEVFTLTGLGNFSGILFHDNTDASGLRFQNFSYNTVAAVPEPGTWALLLSGIGLLGVYSRRRGTGVRREPQTV